MEIYGTLWMRSNCLKVIKNHRIGIKSHKIRKIPKSNFPLGAQNCEKIRKTKVSRFLAFYPLIWAFQTLSRIPNDWVWRDLSFDIKNSWFHAHWLGIQPFLCVNPWKSMEIHGKVQDRHYKILFATEWASRELLGRPVAWYSDVFVPSSSVPSSPVPSRPVPSRPVQSIPIPLWVQSNGNPWKSMEIHVEVRDRHYKI